MQKPLTISSSFSTAIDFSKNIEVLEKFSQAKSRAVLKLIQEVPPRLELVTGLWSYVTSKEDQIASLLFLKKHFDPIFQSFGHYNPLKLKKFAVQVKNSLKNAHRFSILKLIEKLDDAFCIKHAIATQDKALLHELLSENRKETACKQLEKALFDSRSAIAELLAADGLRELAEDAVRTKNVSQFQYIRLIAMGLQGTEKPKFTRFREEIAAKAHTLNFTMEEIWPLYTENQRRNAFAFQHRSPPLMKAIEEGSFFGIMQLLKAEFRDTSFVSDEFGNTPLTLLMRWPKNWDVWKPFQTDETLKPFLLEMFAVEDTGGRTPLDNLLCLPREERAPCLQNIFHLFIDRESFRQVAGSVGEENRFYLVCLEAGLRYPSAKPLLERLSELPIVELRNLLEASIEIKKVNNGTVELFKNYRTPKLEQVVHTLFSNLLSIIHKSINRLSKDEDYYYSIIPTYYSIISIYIDQVGPKAYLDLILDCKSLDFFSFQFICNLIAPSYTKLQSELIKRSKEHIFFEELLALTEEGYGEIKQKNLIEALYTGQSLLIERALKKDRALVGKHFRWIYGNYNHREELKKTEVLKNMAEAYLEQCDKNQLKNLLYLFRGVLDFISETICSYYTENPSFRPILWQCLSKIFNYPKLYKGLLQTTYFKDYANQGEEKLWEIFAVIPPGMLLFPDLYKELRMDVLKKHRELLSLNRERNRILVSLIQNTNYIADLIGHGCKLREIMNMAFVIKESAILAVVKKNYPGFSLKPYMPRLLTSQYWKEVLKKDYRKDAEEYCEGININDQTLDEAKNAFIFLHPNQKKGVVDRIPLNERLKLFEADKVAQLLHDWLIRLSFNSSHRNEFIQEIREIPPLNLACTASLDGCAPLVMSFCSHYSEDELALIVPQLALIRSFPDIIQKLGSKDRARLVKHCTDEQKMVYLNNFPLRIQMFADWDQRIAEFRQRLEKIEAMPLNEERSKEITILQKDYNAYTCNIHLIQLETNRLENIANTLKERTKNIEVLELVDVQIKSVRKLFGSFLKGKAGKVQEEFADLINKIMNLDIPEEFRDPLIGILMTDPLLLPKTSITLDRITLEQWAEQKGLIDVYENPYNRSVHPISSFKQNEELLNKVHAWLASKKPQKTVS